MSNLPSSLNYSHHILVVEPDPLFRLLVCVALTSQFSDFHAVADLREARALLAIQDFSVIIAEQHLQDGLGIELYEEVRRSAPEAPFIMMCGGDPVALADNNFLFFRKPSSISEFAGVLGKMIKDDLPPSSQFQSR